MSWLQHLFQRELLKLTANSKWKLRTTLAFSKEMQVSKFSRTFHPEVGKAANDRHKSHWWEVTFLLSDISFLAKEINPPGRAPSLVPRACWGTGKLGTVYTGDPHLFPCHYPQEAHLLPSISVYIYIADFCPLLGGGGQVSLYPT